MDIGTPDAPAIEGCLEPARDAANPHQIRHHVIARLPLQRVVKVTRPVKILSNLNRRLSLGGELRVSIKIIVDDRLLDPCQPEVVDHVAPVQSLPDVQALIEVDHQFDIVADRAPHRLDRLVMLTAAPAAYRQLEGRQMRPRRAVPALRLPQPQAL